MKKRTLGKGGPQVSEICLGLMGMRAFNSGKHTNESESGVTITVPWKVA